MEGFNDVWANILNGDIINNSINMSEHPSLIIGNKKYEKKEGRWIINQLQKNQINPISIDMNTANIGDISAIDASK